MPKYFFHLSDSADDKEAQIFTARRIGTEKPEMIRKGNSIAVMDARDMNILRSALASTEA